MNNNKIYTLSEYIDKFFGGNQAAFARAQKKEDGKSINPSQVTQWINKDFAVVNHVLHSPRRKLYGALEAETVRKLAEGIDMTYEEMAQEYN